MEAISFASEFDRTIDTPKINEVDVEQELFRRLEQGLLANKYFDYFEKNNIKTVSNLKEQQNRKFLRRAVKQLADEMQENILIAASSSSVITE